jgi:hypothetical protein
VLSPPWVAGDHRTILTQMIPWTNQLIDRSQRTSMKFVLHHVAETLVVDDSYEHFANQSLQRYAGRSSRRIMRRCDGKK